MLLAWASGLATRVDTWGPPPLARMTELFLEMSKADIDVRVDDEGWPPLAPLVHPHERTTAALGYHQEVRRRVYIETSVISYLASRPSRDLVVAARQQLTHTWWQVRRSAFELVISQIVLDEIGAGDADAAARRRVLIADVPLLDVTTETADLAAALIERVPLPPPAAVDAAHMAVAAYHRVDFLMTWNVAHIANAALRRRVEAVCREQGHTAPILCTPDELMEDADDQ